MDFVAVAQQCAPHVHFSTLSAVARQESSFNPFAIGVVGGRLARQPTNKAEAVATARALIAGGWKFSAGLIQIFQANWKKYGIDVETVFDPCSNLRAGGDILSECYDRALVKYKGNPKDALPASFSCYYSGNFTTGFREGYVQSLIANAAKPPQKIRYIQASALASLPTIQQSSQ